MYAFRRSKCKRHLSAHRGELEKIVRDLALRPVSAVRRSKQIPGIISENPAHPRPFPLLPESRAEPQSLQGALRSIVKRALSINFKAEPNPSST
jgi:hypothetical protein